MPSLQMRKLRLGSVEQLALDMKVWTLEQLF